MTEPTSTPSPVAPRAGFLARSAAVALVLTCLAVATGFWWTNRRTQVPVPPADPPKATVPGGKTTGEPLFARWPKAAPDLVLVFSGQTYGYLQPCGCSRPQQGGLERRYNLIQQLKGKGWNVVGLDVGDLLPKPPENGEMPVPPAQTFKKYEYTMKAYGDMGYAAVGLGEYDYKRDVFELLPRYTLNNPNKPPYILSGNVVGVLRDAAGKVTKTIPRDKYFPTVDGKPTGRESVGIGVVVPTEKVPVGVIGLVAPSVADAITTNDTKGPLHFNAYEKHLNGTLAAFAQHPLKPKLNVLLFQGNSTEAQNAAQAFPGVQLIACLTDSSEPPGMPMENAITKQLVIQTGHKGRYVGVLGVFKTPKGFDFHYQLVALGEEYLTPANAEAEKANKALQLLEEYAKDIKDADLLKQFVARRPLHPAQINHPKANLKYVGSEACAKCHAQEYAVWKGHKHSHAYEALTSAKRPGLQQFNGECLVCHTTGFRYETGFESATKTPLLLNNGCENCHGPGSGHVANDKDKELIKAMLPWRLNKKDKLPSKDVLERYAKLTEVQRARDATMPAETKQLVNVRIAAMCMKCHDGDNDPKFDPWTYLPKIYHSGLKQAGLPGGLGK